MRAVVYRGPYRIRVEEDRPSIEHPNDAIVRARRLRRT
jgi:S-(hydroxymethyl)glutathione dehydrogenase / alcohol dehydrogenase